MHTIGVFILNAIRVNEEVLSFDLNALYWWLAQNNCVKWTEFPCSIVAKQVYAEFKNSVLNYCQKFPDLVMLAVHSRENVGYFLFLMLSVLFVCLYNELPQQPVIMQDILAAV